MTQEHAKYEQEVIYGTTCDIYIVSFPDPNNPSEDRLQYLAGKEGLHLTAGNADLRLVCRRTQLLVNYQILP